MKTQMLTFAALISHGPAWNVSLDIKQQAGWSAHADYMDSLVANGTVILGGPLDESASVLHLVAGTNADAVRRRLTADPWHRDGLLTIDWLRPWHLWLDARSQHGLMR